MRTTAALRVRQNSGQAAGRNPAGQTGYINLEIDGVSPFTRLTAV
jgi:hypothetical protein